VQGSLRDANLDASLGGSAIDERNPFGMGEDLHRSGDQAGVPRQSFSGPGQGFSALSTGARVDQYIIHSILGAGGFGITYLAEHQALGKMFAIKEYFPRDFGFRDGTTVRAATDGEGTYRWGLDRFLQEARALARFRHPAIVDVTNVFEENGTAYMVLAYEQARDLRVWLSSLGRMPTQDEIDQLAAPLLDALELIHGANLLHRDVSPDNILVRSNGTPVLIDFGSARDAIRGRAQAMSMVVKHGYSPPEQYTSDPGKQGPWTDIYAFAATLYFAVSGARPMDATARFVQEGFVPVTQSAKGSFRRSFLEAIDLGMQLRPEQRPQSIALWRPLLTQPSSLISPNEIPSQMVAHLPEVGSKGTIVAEPPVRGLTLGHVKSVSNPPLSQSVSPVSKRDSSELWPDDEEWEPKQEAPPQSFAETPTGRAVIHGLCGIGIGSIVGALGSIIFASIINAHCFNDSCVGAYVPHGAAFGAVLGLVTGVLVSRRPKAVEYRSIDGADNY
jgi:serine/threonine protein kinase